MPYARRTDATHSDIVATLRAMGWLVLDTSGAGRGCPDAFAFKAGRIVPLEFKDGAKSKSRRTLTSAQVALHQALQAAGVTVQIIATVEEAMKL